MAANVTGSETATPVLERRLRAGEQLVASVEALLLTVWLGGMIFFSLAVAPAVFAVLPTRELAGQVVNSLIGKLELIGLVCGPLLLLLQLFAWPKREAEAKSRVLRVILLVMMTLLVAASRFWVSAKLHALRAQIGGPIDDVPLTDPLRVEFNALHGVSVSLMGAALLAGLVMIFVTVRLWLKR
jgi:hypothetical protein